MLQAQHLILFDVDGTLTEARRPIEKATLKALRELSRYAEIGFLTGSGLEYIKEQLWPALADPIIRQDLMTALCMLQSQIVEENGDLPLTGNFIQNRGSMINWCPIGRNALQEDRDVFKALDKLYGIRKKYLQKLKDYISAGKMDITVKLGGDTSFDIFPNGWDKTFALNHFEGSSWVFWFVGDRCSPTGNDYEIFSALKDTGRAFEVGSPEETVEIIDFHILRELGA